MGMIRVILTLVCAISPCATAARVSGKEASPVSFPTRRGGEWTIDTAEIADHCEYRPPYNETYKGTPACVRYLATESFYIPSGHTPTQKLLFHMFWRGPFTDVMLMSLKSFLFTQVGPNGTQPAQLWVWLDPGPQHGEGREPVFRPEDEDEHGHLPFKTVSARLRPRGAPLPPYLDCPCIRFKLLNLALAMSHLPHALLPAKLAAGQPNQSVLYERLRSELDSAREASKHMSDLARFVLLYLYGGIHIDGDVLLLRDLRPFQHFDWAYRWSYWPACNTAVMHARQHSAVLHGMIRRVMNSTAPTAAAWASAFHPRRICDTPRATVHVSDDQLFVFPVQLFDLTWLQHDGFTPGGWAGLPDEHAFLDKDTMTPDEGGPAPRAGVHDFVPGGGPPAYHWHNRWTAPIRNGTWAAVFDGAMSAFGEGRAPNMYGEEFDVRAACAAAAAAAPRGGGGRERPPPR